jgi:hypothetical protein
MVAVRRSEGEEEGSGVTALGRAKGGEDKRRGSKMGKGGKLGLKNGLRSKKT